MITKDSQLSHAILNTITWFLWTVKERDMGTTNSKGKIQWYQPIL